jgi:hypothetical protein
MSGMGCGFNRWGQHLDSTTRAGGVADGIPEEVLQELYIQTRGPLETELLKYLWRTRVMRRSRRHTRKGPDHAQIVNAVPISNRPPEVADRAVPGQWEDDLLCGTKESKITALVKRHTRYVMLMRTPRKDTGTVIKALTKHARKLPRELYKSLTWDRGSEMADHKILLTSHRHQSLVLRPAASLATRLKREYQCTATTVLSERHGSVERQPESTERSCETTQWTPQEDIGLLFTSRKICRMCCGDRLNTQTQRRHSAVRESWQ